MGCGPAGSARVPYQACIVCMKNVETEIPPQVSKLLTLKKDVIGFSSHHTISVYGQKGKDHSPASGT